MHTLIDTRDENDKKKKRKKNGEKMNFFRIEYKSFFFFFFGGFEMILESATVANGSQFTRRVRESFVLFTLFFLAFVDWKVLLFYCFFFGKSYCGK